MEVSYFRLKYRSCTTAARYFGAFDSPSMNVRWMISLVAAVDNY